VRLWPAKLSRGIGISGLLQALLEGLGSSHMSSRCRQGPKPSLPYQKRLEDFDFFVDSQLSPSLRLLELAQGAFLASKDNVLFLPQWHRQDASADGLGRALCLAGLSGPVSTSSHARHRTRVAHKELRLAGLLANYRRFDLILVDWLGLSAFVPNQGELLFQVFSDRYERASVALTSNLALPNGRRWF